jgi:hypothetical protein
MHTATTKGTTQIVLFQSMCDSSSHVLHVPSHYWCYTKIPASCFIGRPHVLQGNLTCTSA